MPGLSPAAVQNLLDSYRTLGARTASQNDPIARGIGNLGGSVSDAIIRDQEEKARQKEIDDQRSWQTLQTADQRRWVEQQQEQRRAQQLQDREANYMRDAAWKRDQRDYAASQAQAEQQAFAGLTAPVRDPSIDGTGFALPSQPRMPTQAEILDRYRQMTSGGQAASPALIQRAQQATAPAWTPERAAAIAAASRPPPRAPRQLPPEITSPYLRAFGIEPVEGRQYTEDDIGMLGRLPPPKTVDPTDAAIKDARLAKINAEVEALQMGGRLTQTQKARIDIYRREHMAALRDEDQSRATEAIEAMKRVIGDGAGDATDPPPTLGPKPIEQMSGEELDALIQQKETERLQELLGTQGR